MVKLCKKKSSSSKETFVVKIIKNYSDIERVFQVNKIVNPKDYRGIFDNERPKPPQHRQNEGLLYREKNPHFLPDLRKNRRPKFGPVS